MPSTRHIVCNDLPPAKDGGVRMLTFNARSDDLISHPRLEGRVLSIEITGQDVGDEHSKVRKLSICPFDKSGPGPLIGHFNEGDETYYVFCTH